MTEAEQADYAEGMAAYQAMHAATEGMTNKAFLIAASNVLAHALDGTSDEHVEQVLRAFCAAVREVRAVNAATSTQRPN